MAGGPAQAVWPQGAEHSMRNLNLTGNEFTAVLGLDHGGPLLKSVLPNG